MLWEYSDEQRKLMMLLEEKSQNILEEFKQTTITGFEEPEVISIMKEINTYWKDVYRPAVTSFSYELIRGGLPSTEDAGTAIVLLAAGMGIKDDIIDKSKYTHWRETIPGKYGVDRALLVSDLLLVKGLLKVQTSSKFDSPSTKELIFQAIEDFIFEIYEGEMMDVSCRRNIDTDLDNYLKIIWKLVSDGEVCTKVGAILAGGSKEEVKKLALFGRKLGLIIHLVEEVKDILNVEGSLPHRLKYESIPLPMLYAAKSSEPVRLKLKSILRNANFDSCCLDIQKCCWESKAITYVYKIIRKNARESFAILKSFPPSSARDVFTKLVEVNLHSVEQAQKFEKRYYNAFCSKDV